MSSFFNFHTHFILPFVTLLNWRLLKYNNQIISFNRTHKINSRIVKQLINNLKQNAIVFNIKYFFYGYFILLPKF